MKKERKLNGFTLVELLATIVVISIVFGVGYIFLSNVIVDVKDRSQVISYSNIQKSANLYLKENIENISWEKLEDESEENKYYTCVSTDDLLDSGYLKKKQIDNVDVDYVYVVKDENDNILSSAFDDDNLCQSNGKSDRIEVPTSEEICQNVSYDAFGEPQVLAKISDVRSKEIVISEDTNKGKEAGNYQVKVKLLDETKMWNTKNPDNKPKFVTCRIKKAIPNVYFIDSNDLEEEEVNTIGQTIITKVKSENANGTLAIKSSNSKYMIGQLMDGSDIKIGEEKQISIKLLASRQLESTLTVTFTPEDTKNFKMVSISHSIGKVVTKKVDSNSLPDYCKETVYDGKPHVIVNIPNDSEGFSLMDTIYTEIGPHTIIANLKYGYVWDDGTKDVKEFSCDILAEKEKEEIYVLTYQNGAPCTFKEGIKGKKWGDLCTPNKKNGYTFGGWNGVTKDTIVEGNITAQAKWNANKYTITYNANGGSGAPGVQTYTYAPSGTTTLSGVRPTRTGYGFKGWSQSRTATVASYAAGQRWNLSNANNYTLYAVWEPFVCTVTYNPNGGKFTKHKKETTEKKKYGEFFGNKKNGMRDAAGGYYSATKKGYSVRSKQAWKNGKSIYNEAKRYKAQTICGKLATGNQSVTLKVNWKKNSTTSSSPSSPNCYDYNDTYSAGKSYDSVKGCRIYGDNCYEVGGGYTGWDCECKSTSKTCY